MQARNLHFAKPGFNNKILYPRSRHYAGHYLQGHNRIGQIDPVYAVYIAWLNVRVLNNLIQRQNISRVAAVLNLDE